MTTATNQPTIEQLRKLANHPNKDAIREALKEGDVTWEEYVEGEYLKHNGRYYSNNTYCITLEGTLIDKDNAYFCDYFDEYSENSQTVRIGRTELQYSLSGIEEAGLYYHEGNYYDEQALAIHELVEIDGEIFNINDLHYNNLTEEYQREEPKKYVRSYHHDTTVKLYDFSDIPSHYIGYEIEKEDKNVKQSISISEFEKTCEHWRKEEDGSLDSRTGYELISPAFELIPEEIEKYLKSNPTLLKHINAHTNTKTCGGHINVSSVGMTGNELFERIKGYTPLFYALYYKRVDKTYSKGKSNKDLKEQGEKYQAIRIHRNHLEYRIISAVPNLDTLMWRTKLFELILNYPTNCTKEAFFNVNCILKSHLQLMYPEHRFTTLNERLIKFTEQFEGINLLPPSNNQPSN